MLASAPPEGRLVGMSMSARSGRMVVVVCGAALLAGGVIGPLSAYEGAATQTADACAGRDACLDAALAAEAVEEFERFHDLAWRAVQLGPKDEPEAMYLLARAQVASGRPSDALVMLRRLAQMGVGTDADELDEFERVRARAGWAEVDALTRTAARRVTKTPAAISAPDGSGGLATTENGPARSALPSVPARAVGPSAGPSGAPPSARVLPPLPGVEAVRMDAVSVASGGFAYDAVSGRFLVGNATERKIVVVDEPSRRAADLVRGDSAGFRDMAAMQIDTRRGDLWVVSNEGESATLHKLQLIAGRPLARIEPAAAAGRVRFTDLTITPNGSVLLVDAEGRRLFRVSPRAATLEQVASIDLTAPVAITSANGDGVVYVAHADGIARLDLSQGAVVQVRSSSDVPLDGVRRVWWHDGALVVLRTLASGAHVMQRLELDRRGTTVVSAQGIDVPLPGASQRLAVTLSGHDLFVMTDDLATSATGNGGSLQVVVRRVRLRP